MTTMNHWYATPAQGIEEQFIAVLARQGIGTATANKLLANLEARYQIPIRYYHSYDHAQQTVLNVMKQKLFANNLDALIIAAWFHDVVYWTTAKIDSELASARFARHSLYLAGCSVDFSNQVGELIMDTQHTNIRPTTADGRILADADLVALAAERPQYIIGLKNIRKEYLHVPILDFCAGHGKIMQMLQQRERIFWTDGMSERYETAARSNVNWVTKQIDQDCLAFFSRI